MPWAMTALRAALVLRASAAAFIAHRVPRASFHVASPACTRGRLVELVAPTDSPKEAEAEAEAEYSPPVRLPSNDESDRLLRIRHSTAHVMAMAVQSLYKGTKIAIGPWIEKGFYYDFDPPEPFQDKDLRRIKKQMDKIIQQKLPFVEEVVTREEAERRIRAQDEPYKLEVLRRIKGDRITIYHLSKQQDGWWDLCAGPHVATTGDLPAEAIELESIAGAYLFGDENGPMLQRVYGTAWETKEQLEEYKRLQAEARRRDHRTLGKQLNLFSIQQAAGGGLVFWHPKGATMRNLMEEYWKKAHVRGGYELLNTPHMASIDLWKTSGHYEFYKDDMFDQMEVEGSEYQIKPMNCPFHVLVFKDSPRSYRDLPIRWAELGTVYRYERSGSLNGLFRVRGFTQDDAHIFCLPSQLTGEILSVLDLTEQILSKFGFTEYEIMLSTRPEKAIGSDEIWTLATRALEDALHSKGWSFGVDEGGGAFYGPKIDIKIKDAIGRLWQCSTIQADFNLPERFGLEYTGADGKKDQPIMLHRAIFGSLERFFGVLIESTAGDFPFWIAPVQLRLLPVSDDFLPYCEQVAREAQQAGLRVEVDPGGRSLGKQIKIANQDKLPCYAIVGAKEVELESLSISCRKEGVGVVSLGAIPYKTVVGQMEAAAKEGVGAIDVVLAREE
ncbi:hypothetical protein AB1Y20_015389 [Prymnesium parvum]|uniref:threonine--tRNA ligase n=1 Tax=Prymnesium parvum TaxID=97485 RepID=A0AB34K016_PRYPA